MTTIDLTPTRSEYARICAYILANHSGMRVEDFIGDYWNATPEQESVAIATWNRMDKVAKAFEDIGLNFYRETQTLKKKVIKGALAESQKA